MLSKDYKKKSNQYYVLHVVFYANYAYNSRTFPFLITQNCASTDLHVNSRFKNLTKYERRSLMCTLQPLVEKKSQILLI